MKINANTIKMGHILEYNNDLYLVIKPPIHTKPGKGGAFAQVEMKGIINNIKINERFRSEDKVEKVSLEQKDYQYLYTEDSNLILMDEESFEQLPVPTELLGEKAVYLQDGMKVTAEIYQERILSLRLPEHLILEVVEADAVVKNQTASSSYKPAKLENGVRVLVPPFIENGDKIVVRTEDDTYVERAK